MPFESISTGNGLSKIILTTTDGARAEVYLHGGQVTSWIPANGEEQLFLSPRSEFKQQSAIRGGVPVLFPQFSVFGPLRKHGFARLSEWGLLGIEQHAGLASAIFTLSDNVDTRQEWPHGFQLELAVTIGGNRISLTLSVTNTGSRPFVFTTGLHTYLQVLDVSQVRIDGLQGSTYLDQADENHEKLQSEKLLAIEGETDRIYHNPRPLLTLQDGLGQLLVGRRGFADTVIWNPGAEARLADLEPDSFRSFVCIESATIARPVRLSPDESWQGTQTLSKVGNSIK